VRTSNLTTLISADFPQLSQEWKITSLHFPYLPSAES
jgi:hypothetical protein